MGYYGDKELHKCKRCGFKGKYLEFDPITKADTMDDGTPITTIGFKCNCGYEWSEDEVIVNANQTRLKNFDGV